MLSRKGGRSEGEQIRAEHHRLHVASRCQPAATINRWISPSLSGLCKAGQSQAVGLARPVPYRPSGVLTGACITAHSIARTRGPRASHWPMCATGCEQPSLRGGAAPLTTLIFRIIHPWLHRLIPMVIKLILSGKI